MNPRINDTPFAVIFRCLGDLMTVNILCILCSLPVITAGPAVSAMYAVLLKREREGDVSVISTFFAAFKRNFLQAAALGLIGLAVAAAAAADIIFALANGGMMQTVYLTLGTAIAVIALILLMLPLILQSTYKNSVAGYLKNSFLIVFCAPVRFVLCWLIWLVIWGVMILLPEVFLYKLGAVYLMWGLSGPAWLTAKLLNKVFMQTEENK